MSFNYRFEISNDDILEALRETGNSEINLDDPFLDRLKDNFIATYQIVEKVFRDNGDSEDINLIQSSIVQELKKEIEKLQVMAFDYMEDHYQHFSGFPVDMAFNIDTEKEKTMDLDEMFLLLSDNQKEQLGNLVETKNIGVPSC